MKIGVIGTSPGNGHPFSFSAIFNGYDGAAMRRADWEVIADYLDREPESRFGIGEARVTHAWTQNEDQTAALCSSCRIENAVGSIAEMVREVDAVLLARDDPESHWELAEPFLRGAKPVFVDKPLCVDLADLARFEPYLRDGLLMSCSGMRYCTELDPIREDPAVTGAIVHVNGTIVGDWSRYGIHLLEALLGATSMRPRSVSRQRASHDALTVRMEDDTLFAVNALGHVPKVLRLSLYGASSHLTIDLEDNFGAFRRTLTVFAKMVESGKPPLDPDATMMVLNTIIAGVHARAGQGNVPVGESRS